MDDSVVEARETLPVCAREPLVAQCAKDSLGGVPAVPWGGWKTLGLLGIGFCESPASFLVGIKADCWAGNLRVVSNAGPALSCYGICEPWFPSSLFSL